MIENKFIPILQIGIECDRGSHFDCNDFRNCIRLLSEWLGIDISFLNFEESQANKTKLDTLFAHLTVQAKRYIRDNQTFANNAETHALAMADLKDV